MDEEFGELGFWHEHLDDLVSNVRYAVDSLDETHPDTISMYSAMSWLLPQLEDVRWRHRQENSILDLWELEDDSFAFIELVRIALAAFNEMPD